MGEDVFKRYARILDRLGLALITAILGYGVDQVKTLTENVEKLNTNVAVILVRFESQAKEISELRERIVTLERVIHHTKER